MGPNEVLDKGFIAEDEVPIYTVVRQTDVDHCGEVDAAGGDWVGIAQEAADEVDVAERRVIRVRTMGVSRAVAAGPLPLRTRVQAAADGRVTAATGTNHVVGIVVAPAAAANDWCNVQLTPGVRRTA